MYSVNSAMAKWDIMNGMRTDGSGSADGTFGASLKSMLANQNGIQEMLDRLADRFSSATVTQGKPEAGASGTKEYFGSDEGDKVAVDQSLLAAMFGNNDLSKKVEDAINNFFSSSAGANGSQGTYTQRSISITITTVRYNVSEFDSQSGELMSAQEMMTSLQEKMNELINRLFGKGKDADTGETADDSEVSEGAKSEKASNPYASSGYKAFSFSMELFYSNQLINSMGSGGQGGQMSQFGFSASGSFQSYTGGHLPSAIYDALTNSNDFSGPFTSLIDGGLSNFGMKSTGFQMSQSGFTLKTSSSGDLLSQLMEQLFNRTRPETPSAPIETEAAEVGDVGEVGEGAVEAVAPIAAE